MAAKNGVQILVKNGKPTAVVLSIAEYKRLLRKLDDIEDSKMLKKLYSKKLRFRKLEDFLNEYTPKV